MSYDIAGGIKNVLPGNLDALRGPYSSLSAANSAIPSTTIDVGGIPMNFRKGKFVEIGTGNPYKTYWWRDGYLDANLVEYFGELIPKSSLVVGGDYTPIVVTSYIVNGYVISSGGISLNPARRALQEVPISGNEGKYLHISGLNAGSKTLALLNSSNVLVGTVYTMGSFPYSVLIPTGVTKFNATVKYDTTDTYADLSVFISDSPDVPVDYINKIEGKEISIKKILPGNYAPDPVTDNNVLNLKYFNNKAVKISTLQITDFMFADGVTVFRDMYLPATAFPTAETGSIYVEIPYTTGSSVYFQGITKKSSAADSQYLTSSAYLNAAGTRTTILGIKNGNQVLPYLFNSGVSTNVKIRINIYRLFQEQYFDFTGFNITDGSGKVWVKYVGDINKIEGRGIEPSSSYKTSVNDRFSLIESNVTYLNNSVSTKGMSLNYAIRRIDSTHKRFDAGQIKRCNDGSLICVHTFFGIGTGDLDPCNLAVSQSLDNGRTWSLLNVKSFYTDPSLTDITFEGAPDLYQKPDGNFTVFHAIKSASHADRCLAKVDLTNNGTMWSTVTTLISSWDKTVPGGTGAWTTRSGVVYQTKYRLVSGSTSADAVSVGGLLKSTDGGITFTDLGVDIYDTNTSTAYTVSVFEPGIYETITGTLIYYYRTLQGYCRARKSTDGGATWGTSFNLFRAANSMSNIKRLSFLDNKLNFIYLGVCNPITGPIQSHAIDRRYMGLTVSIDGETFYTTDALIYNYNGNKIAFEPNIYEDIPTGNIYIAWSADTGGIDLYTAIISREDVIKLVNKFII